MTQERRAFLRQVMETAWYAFRNRHIPGSNVRTFADALRNAWSFHRPVRKSAAPSRHVLLRSMIQSPIRRSLSGQAYAGVTAARAGYLTSRIGA